MLSEKFRRPNKRTNRIIADPGFSQNRANLVDSLNQTLDNREDGEQLLYAQSELANSVIHLHEELRKVKKGVRKFDTETDRERFVDAAKSLVHVLRAIADGIAWRSLAYDRASVHELAAGHQTGHIEQHTATQEITRAAEILSEDDKAIVLLNDLTNFIRLGDLTIVKDNTVAFHEIKGGKAAAKSGRAKWQRKQLKKKLEFLNSGDQRGAGDYRIVRIEAKPSSHHDELYETINRARSNGHASTRLSESTAITVFYVEAAAEMGLSPNDVISHPFSGEPFLYTYNSADLVGLFSRNVAPYSIFSLPPEDRVDLMMGKLVVVTWLDARRLMRAVESRGLSAVLPTRSDFDRLPDNIMPGQIKDYQLDVAIKFGNGRHFLVLPIACMLRVGYELLTEYSFADMIDEGLANAGSDNEKFYQAFKEEYWLWD
jgi:hypothetical protein